ncbi:unnamed protein product [Onchocerca flexuosa]|uniref:Acyltransferase n=1 Tax=Onchocerca flexuosa TaxID=387005 RepID=A0A183HFU6_9BILA|nr:unnamed protein product [Onchocerca flexuosa]
MTVFYRQLAKHLEITSLSSIGTFYFHWGLLVAGYARFDRVTVVV